jgi:hypothetical protein
MTPSETRRSLGKLPAEGARKVTVTGETSIERDIDEWPAGFSHALERPAQTKLLAILLQRRSGDPMKHPAQVIYRQSDFTRDVP